MNVACLVLLFVLLGAVPVSAGVDVRRFEWNPKQWQLIDEMLTPKHRYVDVEGGIRAGKTTPLVYGTGQVAIKYPGINQMLARWAETDLEAQLKPAWREAAHAMGLEPHWNPLEQCDELLVGGEISRVYLRGLKPSEQATPTKRFSKVRGFNIARIGIDQAEELPSDFWTELVGRLSQPNYPQQVVITPQPVMDDHWIAITFPEANTRPNYLYIRTNAYDNRQILGEAYIASLEEAYPVGSAERTTLLLGERGMVSQGVAVYKGYFNRQKHVDDRVQMNPRVELLEGWDFGHNHPCVSWSQLLPTGGYQVLGAVMGTNMYLDDFVPVALQWRDRWCPKPLLVQSCCDPAGLQESGQGLSQKVEDILAENGVYVVASPASNDPAVRAAAIQGIARYMRRDRFDGRPAFLINPRAVVLGASEEEQHKPFLKNGFEAGYVWDPRRYAGRLANIRRPLKDGYFDHGQNTQEYIVINFGPASLTQTDEAEAERQRVREMQEDDDPADRRQGRGRSEVRRRGGY